jgi:hypothetical protein
MCPGELCDQKAQSKGLKNTGMVKSDLAREYKKTNFVFSIGIDLIMNLLFKSTEGGARTPVLAALATPDENGNYYTNYQSYENYKK